ncbi:hypothetical protein ED92_38630 [Amycolatopsis sp. MJM2582]|nr:hypothetical protein ED92_38630 [Amycolatopsis sp. MJM2582]
MHTKQVRSPRKPTLPWTLWQLRQLSRQYPLSSKPVCFFFNLPTTRMFVIKNDASVDVLQ